MHPGVKCIGYDRKYIGMRLRRKARLTTEQMFDIITLGSLPGVIFILLNRPINIYPGIGGVNDNGT